MKLKLSDLFRIGGHNFSFIQRAQDVHALKVRLAAIEDFDDVIEEIDNMGETFSLVFADYILTKITKLATNRSITID